MNHRVAVTVLVGVMLLIATPCHAHSLHPVFWGPGPLAPLIMDNQGNGQIYPDLDRQTPYVVVRVAR